MTIGELSKEDITQYFCHATNDVGTAIASLSLKAKPTNPSEFIFDVESSTYDKKESKEMPNLEIVFMSDLRELRDGDSLTAVCIDTGMIMSKQ